jgi:hypothetical protein
MITKDIFICSAFGGLESNLVLARKYCQYVLDKDEDANPFAPHLIFPQFLDESKPEERERGMQLGKDRLYKSKEMWVFVVDGVLTVGMTDEIKEAIACGYPPQYYFDATDVNNIVEMRHVVSGVLPTIGQLLAPKPFASRASKGLSSIAAALKAGARYSDLQSQLDSFLGQLDNTESNPEADATWETSYRIDRND